MENFTDEQEITLKIKEIVTFILKNGYIINIEDSYTFKGDLGSHFKREDTLKYHLQNIVIYRNQPLINTLKYLQEKEALLIELLEIESENKNKNNLFEIENFIKLEFTFDEQNGTNNNYNRK